MMSAYNRHGGTEARRHEVFARERRTPALSHARKGFTLIEMVVVIGIIVALAAIILGVARSVSEKSEVDQTQNVLKLLDLAMGEWETASDRKLSWGYDGTPPGMKYEIQSGYSSSPPEGVAERQTSDCIAKLRSSTGSKEILAKINDKLLVRTELPTPRVFIRDMWDKEIVMVHPGRLYDPVNDPPSVIKDLDGTIRTTDAIPNVHHDGCEMRFGACINRRVCFVSAGPNGRFGDLHLDVAASSLTQAQQADIALAADNIYSYTLSQERAP